jgi:PAS domain S-box-containing protein
VHADFRIAEISGDIETTLGWTPDDLVGRSLYEYVHPSDVSEMRRSHQAWLRSPIRGTRQYRIRDTDGSFVWIESDRQSILDDAGRIVGAEGEWRRLDALPDVRRLLVAIESSELELHYQPIVRAENGTLTQLEALARWTHDGRLVPPQEFISLAEQTGVVRPLTQWVLERALRDRRVLGEQGIDVPVAVNISLRDLIDALFVADVAGKLVMAGLGPSSLVLEITEAAVADVDTHVDARLRELAETGVVLAIDDFGTGQSSIGRMANLPVRELKFDRSLSTEPAANEQLFQVVSALGRDRGLRVVAEGVETETQLATLRAFGVGEIQGYLIARPMPLSKVAGWHASRTPDQTLF